jgi:hypothetical protein
VSYRTIEVEVDHGYVLAKGAESLPENASGLLTILQSGTVNPAAMLPLEALEALQKHLHLDSTQAAEWMASVLEARR